MKQLMTILLASCVLAVAVPAPASAHERHGRYDGRQGNSDRGDWNRGDRNRGCSYNYIRQEIQHLEDGLEHGQRDGSISRKSVRQFSKAIWEVQRYLDYYQNNDGYLDRYECQNLQGRIAQLHESMHYVHKDSHRDRDGSNRRDRDGSYGRDGGDYDRDQNDGRDRNSDRDQNDDQDRDADRNGYPRG